MLVSNQPFLLGTASLLSSCINIWHIIVTRGIVQVCMFLKHNIMFGLIAWEENFEYHIIHNLNQLSRHVSHLLIYQSSI